MMDALFSAHASPADRAAHYRDVGERIWSLLTTARPTGSRRSRRWPASSTTRSTSTSTGPGSTVQSPGSCLVVGPLPGRATVASASHCLAASAEPRRSSSERTQLVADVNAFPGHIACSSTTRSEIVVPVLGEGGAVLAVLDVDSEQALRVLPRWMRRDSSGSRRSWGRSFRERRSSPIGTSRRRTSRHPRGVGHEESRRTGSQVLGRSPGALGVGRHGGPAPHGGCPEG